MVTISLKIDGRSSKESLTSCGGLSKNLRECFGSTSGLGAHPNTPLNRSQHTTQSFPTHTQSNSVGLSVSNRFRISRISVSRIKRLRFVTVYCSQYFCSARFSLSLSKILTLCERRMLFFRAADIEEENYSIPFIIIPCNKSLLQFIIIIS